MRGFTGFRPIRLVPAPVIRAIGRLQLRSPAVRRMVNRLASRLRSGDRVITHGVGAGLKFNAAGANPGYVVGTTEQALQKALARTLSEGKVFYDIGANVGFFTVIGARLVGSAGKVIAFEPVAESVSALRHNVALNGFTQVDVVESAVSDAVGMAQFMVHTGERSTGSRLAGIPMDRRPEFEVSVETVTLDHAIQNGMPQPDVIKLDIEGAEVAALRGMAATLRERRPLVICETHGTSAAVEQLLTDSGYRLQALPGDEGEGWNKHVVGIPPDHPQSAAVVSRVVSELH